MQRRLILMRHAKSSWKSDVEDDHSRPLNKRGRREAPVVAAGLAEMGWTPEMALCSDAMRTRQTLEQLSTAFQPRPREILLPSLYQAGIHQLREAVAEVPVDVTTLLALGHNPGWEEAVAWLCGEEVVMKTANAALLESNGDTWREAMHGEGRWHLIEMLRPKEVAL